MKIYNLSTFFLFLALVSCSPKLGLATPSRTAQSVSSSTIQNIATATANQTATLIATSTPTNLSSHPISTLSKQDGAEITLELLRTNNGCDLPCWWGIIPNQTTGSDAETFLKSFSKVTLQESPTWLVYSVRSPIAETYSEFGEVRAVFAAQQGVVKEIEVNSFDEQTYHLTNLLRNYGVPTAILISTYRSDAGMPPQKVPLTVALYYPEKGIMATYAIDADVKGEKITGCLEKRPTLFLWSPDEHTRSIDYILGWDKDHTQYLDIQKSTGLDVQGFYDKYKNLDEICLQTPASLWPGQ